MSQEHITYTSFYGAGTFMLIQAFKRLAAEPPLSKVIKMGTLIAMVNLLVAVSSAAYITVQVPDSQALRDRLTVNEARLQNLIDQNVQQEKHIDNLTVVQGQLLQDVAVLKVGQEAILRLLWALGLGMVGQIIETFYSNVIRRDRR